MISCSPEEPSPRVLTREQAIADGLTPSQLRNRDVRRPFRDRYVLDGQPLSRAEQCLAALSVLSPAAVISHTTAAALWRLPLPSALAGTAFDPIDVSVPAGSVVPAVRGVRAHGHDLPPHQPAQLRGIAVTCVARTLLDLAPLVGADSLIVLADAALASRSCSLAEIDEVISWARRRRGVRKLRDAVELVHPGSRSPKETELRLILVRAGLPTPEPNQAIFDDGGDWLATGDLVYRLCRIVLEYDGRDHGREERRVADARRRNLLERAGYYVLVFTADDLRRPWSIEADVRHAFAVQSARLGLPDPTRPAVGPRPR